ncbi:hypothetical protein V5R04_09470 [Jonesiaceae bacterium BS-20]|uniref:Uncharacterized protein n=1 Tax=Jonesiaceae bacterium BS-20 TaxID=3120821 RepID=A0AAU7DT49_9MICO
MKAKPLNGPSLAWLAGIVVVVLWTCAIPATRTAAPALGVFGLTASRLLIDSLTLVIIGMVTKKVWLPQLVDLPLIIAYGVCSMAGYFLLLNWASSTSRREPRA